MPSVAGIDPSISCTGLAVIQNDGQHVTHSYRSIKGETFDGGVSDRYDRYQTIVEPLMAALGIWKPKLVLIEDYAYKAGNKQGYNYLIELCWEVRSWLACADWPVRIVEVPIHSIKQFACGSASTRGPNKIDANQVRLACLQNWNVGIGTEDEAIAYACARMGACIEGIFEPDRGTLPMFGRIETAQRKALRTVTGNRKWVA